MNSFGAWIFLSSSIFLFALLLRERWKRMRAMADTERLMQKREAMRRSLEHLSEGVVLLGAQDEVLYANPAANHLLGAKEGQLPKNRPRIAQYTEHQGVALMVKQAYSDETRRQVFEEVEGEDGHPMMEVTLAPAGPQRRLMVLQDLRADEAVHRKRRDFVANASHELKTPISALVGLLDLLEVVPENKRKDIILRAQRNALSLSNLVDDLLALTRAESPDWRPSPKVLNLTKCVEEVIEPLRDRAEKKGLTIDLAKPELPVKILADPFALHTVVQNLVLNAVVYTQSGGVMVEIAPAKDGVLRIRVRDTGPGIDPEILPRIFERFFRGDVAHSRASGGTGLGLALVRNLLRHMGGRVSVQSTPGMGTDFLVELPENPAKPLAGATLGAPLREPPTRC
ncbi:MAG: PAS domain-containing sensor histidine kinase [Planctomycetota bacterium]|nr:PAS domain-containing sensor histidine kinase [Planctomycetota bacterium]